MKDSLLIGGLLTAIALAWIATSLEFMKPYVRSQFMEHPVAILGSLCSLWVTLSGLCGLFMGEGNKRAPGGRLAELDQKFKDGDLPIKRGE